MEPTNETSSNTPAEHPAPETPVKMPADGAQQNISVPASILLAGVLIALAIVYSNGGFSKTPGAGTVPPPSVPDDQGNGVVVDPSKLFTDKDPMLGDPNAPVTVVEFADFQCPFCGKFFNETAPKIIDNYVKTGKVKFIYKHFAFLGEESVWAAEASECAGEQGKFWDYHDYLFTYMWNTYYGQGKSGENVGALSKANLKKFAATLKLNTSQFNSCLDNDTYKDKVTADTNVGRANGVTGTPSAFVGAKMLVGAQPYSQFSTLIDAALANK